MFFIFYVLFLKIPLWITILMESTRRDRFLNMVVDGFIFKTNQSTLFRCFTLIPKTGVALPKTGVTLYWVRWTISKIRSTPTYTIRNSYEFSESNIFTVLIYFSFFLMITSMLSIFLAQNCLITCSCNLYSCWARSLQASSCWFGRRCKSNRR